MREPWREASAGVCPVTPSHSTPCRDIPEIEDRLDCYHERSQRSLWLAIICASVLILISTIQVGLLLWRIFSR